MKQSESEPFKPLAEYAADVMETFNAQSNPSNVEKRIAPANPCSPDTTT